MSFTYHFTPISRDSPFVLLHLDLPSVIIRETIPCIFKKEAAAKTLAAKYIAIKKLSRYLQ